MEIRTKRLVAAVEDYFTGLRRMRASGGATGERSSYGPLAALLDAVGAMLKPRVFCVGELADQGARARWTNVPAAVWTYRLGGYQVLKKWLSYRERAILDRPLLPDEVQHFTDTARRIAAILLTVDR